MDHVTRTGLPSDPAHIAGGRPLSGGAEAAPVPSEDRNDSPIFQRVDCARPEVVMLLSVGHHYAELIDPTIHAEARPVHGSAVQDRLILHVIAEDGH